jgi:hypothetical protein
LAASRRMAANPFVVSTLRDARKGALLRMTSEQSQHPLQMLVSLRSSSLSFSLTAAFTAARPYLDLANRARVVLTARRDGNPR